MEERPVIPIDDDLRQAVINTAIKGLLDNAPLFKDKEFLLRSVLSIVYDTGHDNAAKKLMDSLSNI